MVFSKNIYAKTTVSLALIFVKAYKKYRPEVIVFDQDVLWLQF